MALEPLTISAEEDVNPELLSKTRRFWVSVFFSLPLLVIAMAHMIPGNPFKRGISILAINWIELGLAAPVVVWAGWPFFVRAVQSIVNRSLNMFTLIGLGVSVAFAYSVLATFWPSLFPDSFKDPHGNVGVYFEAAAVIVCLVLLAQVLELRARSRTGAAMSRVTSFRLLS